MERIRAFVAIELDDVVCGRLEELQRRLKQAPLARHGRWVEPSGIHLTLKFLGDVPAGQVPEILQALQSACAGAPPFEIALSGLGCFPNLQRPRVIWVGVEEPSGTLKRLQMAVEQELKRLGFRPEERAFSPHLTLARVRDQAGSRDRAEIGVWIGQQAVACLATMRVTEVCLMRSDLRPTGAIYTRLGSVPLQHKEE